MAGNISPSETGAFDPLADLLVGNSERPTERGPVNLRAVGPLLRALLVTDGTVTKFLEAVTMERVEVAILAQSEIELTEYHDTLEAQPNSRVITRTVSLIGTTTKRHYAEATSLLVVDRLPVEVRRRLEDHPQGIGRILLESRLETRREVLWYGRDPSESTDRGVGGIRRAYRIISGGAPLMLITESFPRDLELVD